MKLYSTINGFECCEIRVFFLNFLYYNNIILLISDFIFMIINIREGAFNNQY